MKTHMKLGLLLSLLPLTVFGHGGDASLIHACVKKNDKALIVEPNEICSNNQVAVHWNIQGIPGVDSTVPGPKGEKGDVGLMGLEGLPATTVTPILWSSSCNVVGTFDIWNQYCADTVRFNTADQHLTVDVNGNITFEVGGFYRVAFRSISKNEGGVDTTGHVLFVVNGVEAEGQIVNETFETGHWNNFDAEITYQVAAGDTLVIRHNFVLYPYPNNHLQIQYLGPLPTTP